MGKLLSGRYGGMPEAESISLSLAECSQKLSLKPTDFVSEGHPKFFEKDFGASGRYLLFLADASDVKQSPVWKMGYYLLPLEAKDVLATLAKNKTGAPREGSVLPIAWENDSSASPEMKAKVMEWGKQSQPLFFKCVCPQLQLRLDAPWALRRRWRARLRCPKRCQPPLFQLF